MLSGVAEELVGSSPPLMAVSPPVVGLSEDVETGRAVGMEIEVADVVDVDPGAAVDDADPVAVTIIVVDEVRPPPGAEIIDVSTYL